MAQTYTADCFAGSHEAQTDLQNMENNFAALKSLFSGTGAPSNTVAGMPWMDTTQKVLKYRNTADAAWYGVMHGDTSQKVWVYRDAAMDGWAVDSGVSDKVLGLKGGATYTTGAATAGSWTVSGLTNAAVHTHTGPSHTHAATVDASADLATLDPTAGSPTTNLSLASHVHVVTNAAAGTGNTGAPSAAETISSDASWRAAAAVGTLQYLDL